METQRKKELIGAYKSAPVVGGIFCIECSGNGRRLVQSTTDMQSSRNRFEFSVKIDGSPDPRLAREWKEYGTKSFSFICLEELEKGEDQTSKEFADDIKTLYEMWLERESEKA